MKFLVFSHLYIALCAIAITGETFLVMDIYSVKMLPYIVMVFFSTIIVYNLKGLREGRSKKEIVFSEKKQWSAIHKNSLNVIFIISLLITIVDIFFLKPITALALFFLGIISIGYSLPFRYGSDSIALREIPFVKTLLVAVVWTITAACLPFIESKNFSEVNWNWVLADFLFLFSLALLFDIKDLKIDQVKNVKTIPLLIGVRNTILLSIGLLIIRFMLIIIFLRNDTMLFMEAITTFLTVSFIAIFVKEASSEYFYMKWIDGLMLVKCLISILFLAGEVYF